jgi:hypothetical protein
LPSHEELVYRVKLAVASGSLKLRAEKNQQQTNFFADVEASVFGAQVAHVSLHSRWQANAKGPEFFEETNHHKDSKKKWDYDPGSEGLEPLGAIYALRGKNLGLSSKFSLNILSKEHPVSLELSFSDERTVECEAIYGDKEPKSQLLLSVASTGSSSRPNLNMLFDKSVQVWVDKTTGIITEFSAKVPGLPLIPGKLESRSATL